MEVSTYEAWEEEERREQLRLALAHPDYVHNRVDQQRAHDQKRSELHVRFPYTVIATGFYPEHDYARRWCWQNISPENGPCSAWQSEYPACPLVLATEYVARGTGKDKNGEDLFWEQKQYTDPGAHGHEGEWCYLWFGKTDYDYGYGEFCFADERDRENFLAAFPTFTWSEEWDKTR